MNSNLLKAELVKKGISVADFGKKIGVSKKTIYSRFNGYTEFTQEEIKKSIEILGLDTGTVMLIFFDSKVS